jgi:L-seryl-tRNA(Ser) seleniumtransferase
MPADPAAERSAALTGDLSADLYKQLDVTPVINAMGHVTLLGGSILSPHVQAAMDAANRLYVSMEELQDKAGRAIANMLGAEAATVTSGAYAALAQGAAGIMTGDDPAKIARLPDSTGMKNEFLIQANHRYHYDRVISTVGGKLVEVGDSQGTTASQMAAAIGPNTAGILHYARGERMDGGLTLVETVAVAQAAGVQVLVDAAGEIYPLERMLWLPRSGAGLIAFGAKYLSSPNSTGILCGSSEMVRAARLNGFLSYETLDNHSVGRGYKLDRQEIVAVTAALQEWLTIDHEERLQVQATRIGQVTQALSALPHVQTRNLFEEEGGPWMRLHVSFDAGVVGKPAPDVVKSLRGGNPSIWVRPDPDGFIVEVHTLREGETEFLASALVDALQGQG